MTPDNKKASSFSEARNLGLKRYFTGIPCKRGHLAERTLDCICVDCVKEVRRKNAQHKNAVRKSWRDANRPAQEAVSAAWVQANPEKVKGYKKISNALASAKQAKKDWVAANPEANKAVKAAWKKANPEKVLNHKLLRQARAKGVLSAGVVAKIFTLQEGVCACPCKRSLSAGFHIDHIVAIFNGGENIDSNIQLLTPECNMKKHTKNNEAFMAEQQTQYGLKRAL